AIVSYVTGALESPVVPTSCDLSGAELEAQPTASAMEATVRPRLCVDRTLSPPPRGSARRAAPKMRTGDVRVLMPLPCLSRKGFGRYSQAPHRSGRELHPVRTCGGSARGGRRPSGVRRDQRGFLA